MHIINMGNTWKHVRASSLFKNKCFQMRASRQAIMVTFCNCHAQEFRDSDNVIPSMNQLRLKHTTTLIVHCCIWERHCRCHSKYDCLLFTWFTSSIITPVSLRTGGGGRATKMYHEPTFQCIKKIWKLRSGRRPNCQHLQRIGVFYAKSTACKEVPI